MSSNGVGGGAVVDRALSAVLSGLDVLRDVDWSTLSDDEVLGAVSRLETVRRRVPSVDHALVAELEVRSVAARRLIRGTAHLLADLLHLDLPDARARVRAAADLGPRTALGGEPLGPAHPATAAAQAAGTISEKHAQVITRGIGALPRSLDPDVLDAAEATLADQAQHLCPAELGRAAERLAAHLDPDGSLTSDGDRARRRHLTIGTQGPDGMSPVTGLLTPECRALLDAALASLTRPTPDGETPDPRTAGQRQHDALAALCSQLLATNTLPTNRGLPATVVITMTLDQLEAAMAAAGDATGGQRAPGARRRPNPDGATARTSTGVHLPLPDALRMATRAHPVLAVFDQGGQPLFVGRGTRTATTAQRLALAARDRGCTRPGCHAPPAWCEVHHLTEWQAGGPTDITNLALVCPYDHHLITTTGYTVTLSTGSGPGGTARVQWTAPAHLDPSQTPRTNPLHHPPDLTNTSPPGNTRPTTEHVA